MSAFPDAAARRRLLEAARWHVLNLDPADVELDLFTDAPMRTYSDAVRDAAIDELRAPGHVPELAVAAEALYGPARWVWSARGRAIELAFAPVVLPAGSTVIANGLFKSTQHAIKTAGALLELAPRTPEMAGSSDLNLAWAEARIAKGGVSAVCVEVSNNALGSWPLHLENLRGLRKLCDAHGLVLMMDATRLLSNCIVLDASSDLPAAAKAYTQLTDVFWVSCAKEHSAPTGAFVGVRHLAQQRKIFASTFDAGTMLEGTEAQARLRRGLDEVRSDPERLRARRRQLLRLADGLRRERVPFLEPVGGHAVYIRWQPAQLEGGPTRVRGIEALFYERSGARALIAPYPLAAPAPLMRIAVTVGRFTDEQVDRVALGLGELMRGLDEVPRLREVADDPTVHEFVKSYERI